MISAWEFDSLFFLLQPDSRRTNPAKKNPLTKYFYFLFYNLF